MDLANKYRPKSLKEVIGQKTAVDTIRKMIEKDVPHVLLFTGPSGCGKTTMCRILKKPLSCKGGDYKEINASISRGIDTIREIQGLVYTSPIFGKSKIWVIDEAHGLTKDAQNSLLKILEDASEGKPSHAYFMLCTTEPTKLLPTIRTRCNEIKLASVASGDLCDLATKVWQQEKKQEVSEEVLGRLVEVAEGSPRKLLKLVQQVIGLDTEEEILDAIQSSDARKVAFDLVKALIPFNGKPNWNDVASVLRGLGDEDPEGIRRLVISVCKTHMLKGTGLAKRAFVVFQSFQFNFFDTGSAGLVAACYNCVFSNP